MAILRRVGLFLATNFLILTLINVLMLMFGINPSTYIGLSIVCLGYGMIGAFISLSMSKFMAKRSMGLQMIDPETERDSRLQRIVRSVHRYASSAGLRVMPEVAVYNSPELNAFATGPSKNNSLVAVSTGLLESMNQNEVDGVLAHEVAHIANGDMVTMTLLQGVINAFVLFLARIVASAMTRGGDNRGGGMAYFGVSMILQMVFGVLGSVVVAWFSRWREYRADAGGAEYAGRHNMIAALQKLANNMDAVDPQQPEGYARMKISAGGIKSLLSTHPPLQKRIQALQQG